ncbi:MAG TPA: YIP1 family protein [Terriglobales bacterium]|nr:YIP1 family protein [Terriglobales bacterium]
MSAASVPTPSELPARMSHGARILNTFISPAKTFGDLKNGAGWWAPWLLISVVALMFVFTMGQEVGFEQITNNEIARSSRAEQFEKLPPDQKAKQLAFSTNLTRVISYANPAVNLLVFVIIAGVLMGTFSVAAGAAVPFARSLAIVIYASLPAVISALLGIVSLVAGGMSGSLDKDAFNVRNPVATNPAYFMDPTGNKFLYGMTSALDIFVIWSIILMGIGFSSNSKLKRGTAIGIVVAWYLVYKLAGATLASIF